MAQTKVKSRTATKKVKDKWKAKQWYKILAPDYFNNAVIAETPADEPEKMIGRVAEATLQDLTGDFSKMHVKLWFKVTEVNGSDARSKFIGHDLTSDYIRRQTRRRKSKVDGVFDVMTKEGYKVRVKPMVIAEKRIQTSQERTLRNIMSNTIEDSAKTRMFADFIKVLVDGQLGNDIQTKCKPIYPLKKVEIRRSEILQEPTIEQISAAQKLEDIAMAAKAAQDAAKAAAAPVTSKPPATAAPAAPVAPKHPAAAAPAEDASADDKKTVKKVVKKAKSESFSTLTEIPGVGAAKAQALYDAGYTTVDLVKKATEEDLSKVLGPALAKKIKTPE